MDDETYNKIVDEETKNIELIKSNNEEEYLKNSKIYHTHSVIIGSIFFIIFCFVAILFIFNLKDEFDCVISFCIGIAILIGALLSGKLPKPNINYKFCFLNNIKEQYIKIFAENLDISVYDLNEILKNYISRNKKELNIVDESVYTQFVNSITGRINTRKEIYRIENFWLHREEIIIRSLKRVLRSKGRCA